MCVVQVKMQDVKNTATIKAYPKKKKKPIRDMATINMWGQSRSSQSLMTYLFMYTSSSVVISFHVKIMSYLVSIDVFVPSIKLYVIIA